MTAFRFASLACALMLPLALLGGCEEEGTFEKAGERADENIEKAAEEVEEAADELEDAVDDATDSKP